MLCHKNESVESDKKTPVKFSNKKKIERLTKICFSKKQSLQTILDSDSMETSDVSFFELRRDVMMKVSRYV